MSKKVEKVNTDLPEIKAKQVGSNLLVMIGTEKFTKSKVTKEDVTKIKLKIDLYNKKPSESKKEEILRLVSKTVVEKEKKEALVKGTKKAIKKEVKKVTKSKSTSKGKGKDLVETVKVEFKAGNISESERQAIINALKITKKELEEEPKAVVKAEERPSHGRERY